VVTRTWKRTPTLLYTLETHMKIQWRHVWQLGDLIVELFMETCLVTWRSNCGTFHGDRFGDMVISHVETIMETSLVILIEIFCWRHWRYGEKLFLLLKNPKKGDTIPRTCHNLIFTPFKNKNFIKILRKQNLIDFCKKRKEKIVA